MRDQRHLFAKKLVFFFSSGRGAGRFAAQVQMGGMALWSCAVSCYWFGSVVKCSGGVFETERGRKEGRPIAGCCRPMRRRSHWFVSSLVGLWVLGRWFVILPISYYLVKERGREKREVTAYIIHNNNNDLYMWSVVPYFCASTVEASNNKPPGRGLSISIYLPGLLQLLEYIPCCCH